MRLLEDWQTAQSDLQHLQHQLEQCEQRLEQLHESANPAQLAQTLRAEGAIFYNTGSLQALQRTMLERQVLIEAVTQQAEIVGRWEQRLGPHRLEWLRRRRDELVQEMDQHVAQLAELAETLRQIEAQAADTKAEPGEFDARQRLDALLARHGAADCATNPATIRLPKAA